MLAMVSKCEAAPGMMRSKLDYSGGSPVLESAGSGSARVRMPIDIAELPIDACCGAATLKQSGHHAGGKILKFFKLRKKASEVSQEALQPALTTFRFQEEGSKRFASVEDVDMERYHYDSDEQSSSSASERRRRHSCSTSASSSTRSSASAQSFRSMTAGRSCYTTPRTSFIVGSGGHQSSAQLMANILISISHLDEDDDVVELSESVDDHPALNGPHESAWVQPWNEVLAESAKISSSAAKQSSSGRNTSRIGRCSLDVHLKSPGPSRRFGKLDLSRIEKLR